nr:palmitoyltransferase ZDHHC15B-like [Rhipicephalus microplus]
MAMLGEAYYAYLFIFCGRYVQEDAVRLTLATVFHLPLLFCLWSYAQTTFTPPPCVPSCFQFTNDERRELARCSHNPQLERLALEDMATRRGILTRFASGAVSRCKPCDLVKPDRCHHCSKCKRCVLKMDHHCPWFNNCVCFSTYKFFLLTLFYVVFLAAYAVASVAVYMLHKNPRRRLLHRSRHITFLLVVGGSTFVMMGGFLCAHLSFVVRNRTTIESARRPSFKESDDSFDIGARRNFLAVFGLKAALWLIPVFTSLGDGCHFPTRRHPDGTELIEVTTLQCAQSAGASAVAADPKAYGEPGPQGPFSASTPKDAAVTETSLAVSTHSDIDYPTPEPTITTTMTQKFNRYPADSKYICDGALRSSCNTPVTAVKGHTEPFDDGSMAALAPVSSTVSLQLGET